MACLQFDAVAPSVAVASALQTQVGVKNPAQQAIKILESATSMDGSTSTATPAVVDWCFCTFATNSPGTNSTSITLVAKDNGRPETIQSTAGKTWTTEPTTKTIVRTLDVPQFDGLYHYINPFASPFIAKGGTGFVLQITRSAAVNASSFISAEE